MLLTYLIKVGSYDSVQYSLTVRSVHHNKSRHLRGEWRINDRGRQYTVWLPWQHSVGCMDFTLQPCIGEAWRATIAPKWPVLCALGALGYHGTQTPPHSTKALHSAFTFHPETLESQKIKMTWSSHSCVWSSTEYLAHGTVGLRGLSSPCG